MSADIKCPACVHGQCGMCGREYASTDALAALTRDRDSLRETVAGWLAANGPGGWIDSLRAELDALKRQAPVAWFNVQPNGAGRGGMTWPLYEQVARSHWGDVGTVPLYAAPTPAAADAEALRDARRYRWLEEHTVATGLVRWIAKGKHQLLGPAVDAALAADAGRAEGGKHA